jgi:4-diphosphocytidyl-2-C-methyl-D-erythritol kinase
MTAALHEEAPAKLNLSLILGPARPQDGRHDLVTLFQPVTLADRVRLEPAALGVASDEVVCPGVEGENLAAAALRAFRERTGWRAPPVRLVIEKRIPVAAGLAGGSADAAAALRLAARASGVADDALLLDIAGGLGADVPAQVRPARYLATGAGERLEPVPEPPPFGVLVLRSAAALPTTRVFAEADRQGLGRDAAELERLTGALRAAAADGPALLPAELAVNDLEPAARALCPPVGEALDAARAVGADRVLLCGSGPTVLGLFGDVAAARGAAVALGGREPRPLALRPWAARAEAPA